MTPEEERWAEALAVQRWQGDAAPIYVAERIGALALDGDQAGVDRWLDIARRIDQLRNTIPNSKAQSARSPSPFAIGNSTIVHDS